VAFGSGGEEPAPAQTAAPSPKTETVAFKLAEETDPAGREPRR
jgi:hypothetical protein